MKLIITTDLINKAIDSIARRGKRLDMDIHKCAVSIVNHVNEYHEVTLVNRLVDSMPKGARSNALRDWFENFCKCVYNKESKQFDFVKGASMPLEPAIAEPWFEFKPEPEFKAIDSQKLIDSLFKTLSKGADSEHADLHAIDPEHLKALASLATAK